jgi:hypothetical protein
VPRWLNKVPALREQQKIDLGNRHCGYNLNRPHQLRPFHLSAALPLSIRTSRCDGSDRFRHKLSLFKLYKKHRASKSLTDPDKGLWGVRSDFWDCNARGRSLSQHFKFLPSSDSRRASPQAANLRLCFYRLQDCSLNCGTEPSHYSEDENHLTHWMGVARVWC